MARNRTSRMVILGVGGMILIVGGVGAFRLLGGPSGPPPVTSVATGTQEEETGVGEAMADRPGETVRALAQDIESLRDDNEILSETVTSGISEIGSRITGLVEDVAGLKAEQEKAEGEEAGLTDELDRMRAEMSGMRSLIEQLQERDDAFPVEEEPAGLPGQGVPGEDGYLWFSASASPDPVAGAIPGTGGGLAALSDLQTLGAASGDGQPPEPLPVYTVPAQSALVRSRGLTALIGRVPIQGQIADPFPFRVITGRDNLLPGGHVLPELEMAVWSGIAKGDATLHCASGELTRVTFLFRDGSISEWPRGGGSSGSGGIGWISDDRGFPCIPGKFVSNLKENIAGITSSAAAASIAQAWSESQVSTTRDGAAITRTLTGDPVDYALGKGLAGGIGEWSRIIAERAREAFDAVVVEAGHSFTVHVDETIPIDWPPEGRRVRHLSASTPGDGHRPGGLD